MSGTSAQCHSAGLQFGAAVEDVETTLTAQRSGKRFQDPTTVVSYVVENKDTKGRPLRELINASKLSASNFAR